MLARERLAALGIGAALLHENIEKGVRSPVIGTYRLAVHRLQKQASSQPPTPDSVANPALHTVSKIQKWFPTLKTEEVKVFVFSSELSEIFPTSPLCALNCLRGKNNFLHQKFKFACINSK